MFHVIVSASMVFAIVNGSGIIPVSLNVVKTLIGIIMARAASESHLRLEDKVMPLTLLAVWALSLFGKLFH
jgi:hypothetical protein